MSATKNHRGWGYIRQLPNKSKRWQASYIGPDGKRHNAPVTFEKKIEAEMWLGREHRMVMDSLLTTGAAWSSPAERAAVTAVEKETLAVYAKRWIEQRSIKPRTRIHYESLLTDHIAPRLGGIAVSDLTSAAVRTWYAATLTDKPTLRSHAYGLLKSICATAVKDGLIDRNPCQIDGAASVKSKTEPVPPSISELASIADTIKPERFRALILISAWCGLRYGEVGELRRRDIGKGCEVISVGRAFTHREGCRIDTPKSGKPRIVVVPPHIRDDIEAHLSNYVGPQPDSLLFPPIRGGCHLSDKVLRDALAPVLKSIGIQHVRIHDLRHFAGTQVARVGNLVETMNHLGHSTVSASLRYQHQVSGRDAEIASALSALAQKPRLEAVG
jgi:integrase